MTARPIRDYYIPGRYYMHMRYKYLGAYMYTLRGINVYIYVHALLRRVKTGFLGIGGQMVLTGFFFVTIRFTWSYLPKNLKPDALKVGTPL